MDLLLVTVLPRITVGLVSIETPGRFSSGRGEKWKTALKQKQTPGLDLTPSLLWVHNSNYIYMILLSLFLSSFSHAVICRTDAEWQMAEPLRVI